METTYSYGDIGLYPNRVSQIVSREHVVPSINFLGVDVSLPIIVAPMESVVNKHICQELNSVGGLACLPRDDEMNGGIKLFNDTGAKMIPSFSSKNIIKYGYWGDNKIVCLDIANGFSTNIGNIVKEFKAKNPDVKVISGNVGSVEGYKYLGECGVDAVRVGIGVGAGCLTSMKTAVGCGQWTLVRDIANFRHANQNTKMPQIIADGGIHSSRDIVLAIAAGADIAMCGRLFAGIEGGPGPTIKYNNRLYKQYAGQASRAIKRSNDYVEGDDTLVPLVGELKEVWKQTEDGIRSAMSYMNAVTIKDLKHLDDSCFKILSPGSKIERDIHA